MYKAITSWEEYKHAIDVSDAALFYFSHEQCNVCKILKPKVEEMILSRYPKINLFYCDTVGYPEIAAQQNIFTVPTLLVFFDHRELFRKSRNMGIEELSGLIERPYKLMFG